MQREINFTIPFLKTSSERVKFKDSENSMTIVCNSRRSYKFTIILFSSKLKHETFIPYVHETGKESQKIKVTGYEAFVIVRNVIGLKVGVAAVLV